MNDVVASIDCGTNSTRLLVHDGARPLARLMRITRLGEGVGATGRLAPGAIERTREALVEFREVIEAHGAKRIRMTATSAARDAANRDDFFDVAEAAIGVRPELLSGQDEGRLAFLGATAELDPALGPFLVVDIGGGSTEFSFGTSACEYTRSTDMGCVRFTEKFIAHDPPMPEELVACLSVAEAHVDEVVREHPAVLGARTFVGLAGTVSTAAAVEIGLAEYDSERIHHFALTRDAVEDVFRTLATEPRADRIHNPGLEPERADVIVAGLCVLVQVMRQLGLDECLVSESDILDGLAMSLRA
jgi:exopolyphosphatase / guanosine-5'-triphosphate,3'-diphosphate pyrophosphatase